MKELSNRELEVAVLYLKWEDTKSIGEMLKIRPGTVLLHLANARKACDARSTFHLLSIIMNNGADPASICSFSELQLQIFNLMREGKTGTQIAALLEVPHIKVRREKGKMLSQNYCGTMLQLLAKYLCISSNSRVP
jgi:DNA-binding NarL/FixJ family response regulator